MNKIAELDGPVSFELPQINDLIGRLFKSKEGSDKGTLYLLCGNRLNTELNFVNLKTGQYLYITSADTKLCSLRISQDLELMPNGFSINLTVE